VEDRSTNHRFGPNIDHDSSMRTSRPVRDARTPNQSSGLACADRVTRPGTFEEPKAPVYVDGRLFTTLRGAKIVAEFIKILDDYVESHYAAKEKEEVGAGPPARSGR
jgi:hypothetical protein